MVIHGLQKMTVLDFPGKIACTVFTAGCNLRCGFCHNARLVTHPEADERLDEQEVLSYIYKRKGMLDGVCITGGEPLLQPDIKQFIRKIKETGLLLKLDTNGCYPEKLRELLDEKLVDYVAMDIKNSPEEYGKTVGVENFDITPIKQSIEIIKASGVDYEFRTTVVRELHTKESLLAAAELIAPAKQWFLQGFVDSGDTIDGGFSAYDKNFMKELQESVSQIVENVELRGI
ncbi:MAG: anaerobic ribonucleoside-triphosphate reductase activating protein [Clostridia bacterium]|nr:anaerobic ribonucleoside-triphosphate reductase activating protein [Clostridia bacterium]